MSIDDILDQFKDLNHVYNDCTKMDLLRNMLEMYAREIAFGSECETCNDDLKRLTNSYNSLKLRHDLLKKQYDSLFNMHKELVDAIDWKLETDNNKLINTVAKLQADAKKDFGNCTKQEVYRIALADLLLALGDVT